MVLMQSRGCHTEVTVDLKGAPNDPQQCPCCYGTFDAVSVREREQQIARFFSRTLLGVETYELALRMVSA